MHSLLTLCAHAILCVSVHAFYHALYENVHKFLYVLICLKRITSFWAISPRKSANLSPHTCSSVNYCRITRKWTNLSHPSCLSVNYCRITRKWANLSPLTCFFLSIIVRLLGSGQTCHPWPVYLSTIVGLLGSGQTCHPSPVYLSAPL